MKLLASLFKQFWFITLIILIVVALSIWFFGPLFAFADKKPLATNFDRLLVIFVLTVGWGLSNVLLYVRKSNEPGKTNKEDEKDQSEQDKAEVTESELDKLQHTVLEDFNVIRQLYARYNARHLPAYIVIGAKQIGKTALLQASGLDFPLQTNDLVEHRLTHVQCWFSNQAVFFELASDMQQDCWQLVLAELKKINRNKSVSGIVLCLSAAEIVENSAKSSKQYLRQRLEDLMLALNTAGPIYLTITQMDRLEGFQDFFANYNAVEAQQLWGFTFNRLLNGKLQWQKYLHGHLKELRQRLVSRTLTHLQLESVTEHRSRVFAFPEQFKLFGELLIKQAIDLFNNNRYYETPAVRGIFLTSACQTGYGFNLALQQLQSALGLMDAKPQLVNNNKSYFIEKLFKQLILAETKISVPSASLLVKHAKLENVSYVGAGLLLVATLLIWTHSYRFNMGQLEKLNDNLVNYQAHPTLENLANSLHIFAAKPLVSGGLSLHNNFQPLLAEIYTKAISKNMQNVLIDIFKKQLTDTNGLQFYKTLQVYYMLVDVQYYDREKVLSWLRQYLAQAANDNPEKQQALMELFQDYLKQQGPYLQADPVLINAAKQKLLQLSPVELVYQGVKNAAPQSVNVLSTLDPAFQKIFVNASINWNMPELYTRAGALSLYPLLVDPAIKTLVSPPQLINSFSDEGQLKLFIDKLYLQDYIKVWQSHIDELKIIKFNNVQQAAQVTGLLAQKNSPLEQVLQTVNYHTNIAKLNNGTLAAGLNEQFSALNNLVNSQQPGQPLPYVAIQTTFAELASYLNKIATADNPQQAALNIAKQRFSNPANNDPITALLVQAKQVPEPLRSWLMSIANQSWESILALAQIQLNEDWDKQINQFYQLALAGKYPLANNATAEVALADFNSFFAPNAKLDNFINTELQPFIDTTTWNLREVNGQTVQIDPRVLKFLQQSKTIQSYFFAAGAQKMQLTFSLQPISLSVNAATFQLTINGQSTIFQHGPLQIEQFNWPAGVDNSTIQVSITGLDGQQAVKTFTGPWALFRLMQASNLQPLNSSIQYKLNFNVGRYQAAYMLRAEQAFNPFGKNLFKDFSFPTKLMSSNGN